MAKKDYKSKTGVYPASAEAEVLENGSVLISLYDENGKKLDEYTIDPETGIGISENGKGVDLPQTGNNSWADILIAFGAIALIGIGGIALRVSGTRRRREE